MLERISQLAERLVIGLSRRAVSEERRFWLRTLLAAGGGLAAVVGFPHLLLAGQQGPCPPMVNANGFVVCGDTSDNKYGAKANLTPAIFAYCGTQCVGRCKAGQSCQIFSYTHGVVTISINGRSFQACTPMTACFCVCRPAPA